MSHKDEIPTLLDICREIDEGSFEMQEDEIIVYYPSQLDVENDTPAISDLTEILFLYDRRKAIMNLLARKGFPEELYERDRVIPIPIKRKRKHK